MRFLLAASLLCQILAPGRAGAAPAEEARLPPVIHVTEHGGVARRQFPVTGGIPLPRGALQEGDLARLVLLSDRGTPVPAQFTVAGRWTDGSVKWLLLDFQSTQDARNTARYQLRLGGPVRPAPAPMARDAGGEVEVNTGRLRARFGRAGVEIRLRGPSGRQTVVNGSLVSRIGVRRRDETRETTDMLPLARATLETNGPMRAVVKVEGWHTAANGDRFSPSTVRLTFYRGSALVRVHHTFVNSKDPDAHLISGIFLDVPLVPRMETAAYTAGDRAERLPLGSERFAIFQENLYRPTYPPPRCTFQGRYRILSGAKVVAEGERYPGALVLHGPGLDVGVFVKNMRQMSPKGIAYRRGSGRLEVGLWPGEDADDLDLMRAEVRKPEHYQEFARRDPLYRDAEYPPTYVPHDLAHSAMGLLRTHEVVLAFASGADGLDPVALGRLFTMPFVPFVSGEWNVRTGAMGKQVLPGRYRADVESTNARMTADLREQIERWGWYGFIEYGNVRYAWDKTKRTWMDYHPKFAWFNAGHMMLGGTMVEALWFQYLRSSDPHDFLLAEARGSSVADISTVHYHEDPSLVGAMIRHGGFDPWTGNRRPHGEHAPLGGLPLQYYVTGSSRIADVVHRIGRRNYQERDFNHGRAMDTDINTMMHYYQFTLDRRYYDRAVEFIDYYHRTLEEARKQGTYFEYFTTALRTFYDMCDDAALRQKIKEIFLARLETTGRGGNLEAAAFAYELTRSPEAARQLEAAVEERARLCSGHLGWSDNMVLRGMNDFGTMNAVVYALYWLQEARKDRVEPVVIQRDGGTFEQPVRVTLSCETAGSTIRYTLDGSEPTERSPEYREPLALGRSSTLRARAFQEGLRSSDPTTATFTIGGPRLPREKLELWLKADAGVARDGTAVVSWADQSGHGRHALAVAGQSPAFVPDRLGGLPALRGSAGKSMRLRRLAPLSGDATFLFVAAFTGNNAAVVGDGDDGWIGLREVGSREFGIRFSVGEPGVTARLRDPYTPGAFAVWSVVREGTRVRLYRDGVLATEKPDYSSGGTPMNLGLLMGMRPAIVNLQGELAELLVFGTALSDEERARVEQYLASRYGLRGKAGVAAGF